MNKPLQSDATVGIYLHIPFCIRKCAYCDFCSAPAGDDIREAYVTALCREIRAYPGGQSEHKASGSSPMPLCVSVFFGGGTPSLLTPVQLARVMDAVAARFPLADNAECSMEVNPATADAMSLRGYRAAGINRVSIGVQSMIPAELTVLGRLHTAQDALRCIRDARAAGFDNLNTDLMYGIPGQTALSWEETLMRVLAESPEHISAYALIVEPGTPFYARRESLALPSDDLTAEFYTQVTDRLRASGYRHYEISNYAKPGCECRHNLRYWERRDYLGFGIAAHSCVGQTRAAHGTDIVAYMRDPTTSVTASVLPETECTEERVMLGLRLDTGVSRTLFTAVCGNTHREFIERCTQAGYLRPDTEKIALTDRGMFVSSAILCELLPGFPAYGGRDGGK